MGKNLQALFSLLVLSVALTLPSPVAAAQKIPEKLVYKPELDRDHRGDRLAGDRG